MTAEPNGASGGRQLIRDVQRFGLLSAATVADRYIQIVDRAIIRDPVSPVSPSRLSPNDREAGLLVDGATWMAEALLRLLDATATLIPDTAASGTETLLFPAVRSGSTSEASLWVHNPTSAPTAVVGFHVTSLVSPHGHGIPVDAISFSPQRVDRVEPGTSREVRLCVEVPPDQPAGEYHGLVLSSAAPDEGIVVRLAVQAGVRGSP